MLGALALGDGPASAPQIAEAMGVTRQGAQKQIHLLVQDGLIEAQPNPAHKRSPRYVLTEAGRRVYARVEQQWQAHAEAVAANWHPVLGSQLSAVQGLPSSHFSGGPAAQPPSLQVSPSEQVL